VVSRWLNPERIAVVEVFGALGSAVRTAEFVRIFRALEENDRVRAVVVDIDSPGGSASASGYLHRALARVSARKPVVAFIRGMGASGGYLLSCAATKVVAIPGGLVGSIGVISIRPLFYEFMRRYGIGVSITKSGRLKDMWYPFREPTEEEKQKEQALLDEFYEDFVSTVAKARNLDPERARTLATGEVFTASQAKEASLVDELGDLERAIEIAMELGKVPRRLAYVRPRRGLRTILFQRMASAFVEEIAAAVEQGLRGRIDYRLR
jgi:protease IV